MTSFLGTNDISSAQAIGIFVAILFTLGLATFVVRGIRRRRVDAVAKEERAGRPPRLGIVGIHELDERRQLILLRRDGVEHLLLVGGPNDLVVETGIRRESEELSPTMVELASIVDGRREPDLGPESPFSKPEERVRPVAPRPVVAPLPEALSPGPVPRPAPVGRVEPTLDATGPAPAAGSLVKPIAVSVVPAGDAPEAQAPAASPRDAVATRRGAPTIDLAKRREPAVIVDLARLEDDLAGVVRPAAVEPDPVEIGPRPVRKQPDAVRPPEDVRPARTKRDVPPAPRPAPSTVAGPEPAPADAAPLAPSARADADAKDADAKPVESPTDAVAAAMAATAAVPPQRVPPRPTPRPAPPTPSQKREAEAPKPPMQLSDPFSVDEIEAEFARLLGRPLDKVG